MNWLEALKEWRSKGGKGIPKKGSDAYNEVRSMMSGEAKAVGPVGEGGKGPMLMEGAGGFKTSKGIEPMKVARKKRVNKLTHHKSGRKIRSDKGKPRVIKPKSKSEEIMLAKDGPEKVKKKRKAVKEMKKLMAPGESYHVQVDANGKVVKKMIKDKSGDIMVEV
jgi:hypothetical protein